MQMSRFISFSILLCCFVALASATDTASGAGLPPNTELGRKLLVQGQVTVQEDVVNIPNQDLFTYMVAIGNCGADGSINNILCGGSLIHPQVVLTAAHCLRDGGESGPLPNPANVCIVHGAKNLTRVLNGEEDPKMYEVLSASSLVTHPNFKELDSTIEYHLTGDVGLIFLNGSIPRPARNESWIATHTTNPGFVLLPNPKQKWDLFDGFSFFSVGVGWGLTENFTDSAALGSGDPEPQRLDAQRIVFQNPYAPEFCKAQAPKFYGITEMPDDAMCIAWAGGFDALFAGAENNNTVVSQLCKGDSGGPLVVPAAAIEPFNLQGDVQIGVVSTGPPCPRPAGQDDFIWPGEVANVALYVDWIHQQMEERGLKPLLVATNPFKEANIDPCSIPCFDENVMEGDAHVSFTLGASLGVAMIAAFFQVI